MAPPGFEVDPHWPKALPNNWIFGQVAGVAVDRRDHIWIVHRPRSLQERQVMAGRTPQPTICCIAAPPVLVFDMGGNLVRSWGGPARAMNGRKASTASMSTTRTMSGSPATARATTSC